MPEIAWTEWKNKFSNSLFTVKNVKTNFPIISCFEFSHWKTTSVNDDETAQADVCQSFLNFKFANVASHD